MALLNTYGQVDYQTLLNKNTYADASETLLGMSALQPDDFKSDDKGFLITTFKKSFWGKKETGYVSFKFIEDFRADLTKFDSPPPFCDIVIGMEFHSVFDNVFVEGSYIPYKLGKPRKQLLSYGLFLNHATIFYNGFNDTYTQTQQEELDNLQNMPFDTPNPFFRSSMLGNELKRRQELINKIKFFERFESLSLGNEQFLW